MQKDHSPPETKVEEINRAQRRGPMGSDSLRREIAKTGKEIKESIIAAGNPVEVRAPEDHSECGDFGEATPGAWRNHGKHGFPGSKAMTRLANSENIRDLAEPVGGPAMRAVLKSVMPHQAQYIQRPSHLRTRECWGFGDLVMLVRDKVAFFLQGAKEATMAIKNMGGYGENGGVNGLQEAMAGGLIEKSGDAYKLTEAGRRKADALEGK